MLQFKPICAEDYKNAAPIMKASGFGSTESSFVDVYMWGSSYNTQICVKDDTVFLRAGNSSESFFLFPLGGDTKSALVKIRETSEQEGISPVFNAVTERMRLLMEATFPGEFEFSETRDYFDYIYSSRDLIELKGQKFHQKRNHFNKFIKAYTGRYSYEDIDSSNIDEVREFQKKWIKTAYDGERDDALNQEAVAINRVLDNMFSLDVSGGLIRIDGAVCAYSLGTKISDDTFVVMTEKGDYAFKGIYQAINKLFCERNCSDIAYVNREDDAGSEGLRHAKLSYNPELLLKKYRAVWKH